MIWSKPLIEKFNTGTVLTPGNKWIDAAQRHFIETKARGKGADINPILKRLGLDSTTVTARINGEHNWFGDDD